jgi:hypothetical protein
VRDRVKHLPVSETALSMVSALWIHPAPYLLQQLLRHGPSTKIFTWAKTRQFAGPL